MEDATQISQHLQDVTECLSTSAIKSLSMIFGKDVEIETPWHLVHHLDCHEEHLISIGSANNRYSSLILLGVSELSVKALLGDMPFDQKFLFDILGELLNTYCAHLDDNEIFSQHFGKQIQSVPVMYSDGAPFIPFLQGVQGRLKMGDAIFYVGFVVRENMQEGE